MMKHGVTSLRLSSFLVIAGLLAGTVLAEAVVRNDGSANPYDRQVAEQVLKLAAARSDARTGAAEALGFLRAYSASAPLVRALRDPVAAVRREAAMALAWCGGRPAVAPLLTALDDDDPVSAQAAWVALTNLTGMEWSFDPHADATLRAAQTEKWRAWWATVPDNRPPAEVLALARAQDDNEARLRGVRALGALGGDGAIQVVMDVLRPFRQRDYAKVSALEKHLAQSCFRSLGRSRAPEALAVLIDYLDTAPWARYAADALGDFGSADAVGPLIAAYPRFSRGLSNRQQRPELYPRDDRFFGDNTHDRMPETPYAIAVALTRLTRDTPDHVAGLRKITPYILTNLPSDWDGGMLYEPEAFAHISASLLERAGLRQAACDAAIEAALESKADKWLHRKADTVISEGLTPEQCIPLLARKMYGDVPHSAAWLPALCRDTRDVPRLLELLEHDNGWVRIDAIKALMFIGDPQAVEPIAERLAASKPEALYGYSGALEHAEYNDPAPRWREALIRAIGRFGAQPYAGLLTTILEDPRNVIDIQHAAALALDELGSPEALAALARAEVDHPFHSVRLVAREALWRRGRLRQKSRPTNPAAATALPASVVTDAEPLDAIVFIKGAKRMRSDFNGQAGVDPWRQTYTVNNSGPTMRLGRNLYVLRVGDPKGTVAPLTHFEHGFVADCEVSWDGKRILFARRLNGENRNYDQMPERKSALRKPGEPLWGGKDDPWWHVWEINADGTGLRQITRGPYHDVQPAFLPDGRIVFSSTRIGVRDEYHGFPSTGLTIMNADGSDIHLIGFNLGGDREPAVLDDGRIVFSRLDIFYSRLKTELTLQTVFPDGTQNSAFYGPERRAYWNATNTKNGAWALRGAYGGQSDNRNRVLRLSQPQPFGDGRVVCATSSGLALVGPGRHQETLVPHERKMAVTSPFPLGDGRILCAATIKQFKINDRIVTAGTPEFDRLNKGPRLFRSATNIDLALYTMDAESGKMTLLYNDPDAADFEARPIRPRRRPPVLSDSPVTREQSFTAKLFCKSARISQTERVRTRGKLLRVIEGRPIVSRHETQQNVPPTIRAFRTNRWRNHGGTHARVLGTVPLAADGSFHVEVPADRLLHLQVLDSDRRVLGNQLFWMYARPGETRSCVGCHENRNQTQLPDHGSFVATANQPPVEVLPTGNEFSYRAKAWLKGAIPDECEERTRTVRAVNLIGRY